MSVTETLPQPQDSLGKPQGSPAEMQRPDNFIGEISHWVGNIAIPAASADLDEAGHRHDAAETYSELPVEVAEFEEDQQEELLRIFKDKPYERPIHFVVNPDTEEVSTLDMSNGDPSLKAETYYSPEELSRITELLSPTASKILKDFKQFKGQAIQPHSLVDEYTDNEDIEFDEPRPRLGGSPISLQIELRGGTYENSTLGAPDAFYFHGDGPKEGINTAYIGSFVEKGKKPLPTYIAPGLYPPKREDEKGTSGFGNAGSKVLGVDNFPVDTAKIFRVSIINETRHSSPPEDGDPRTRVFMRAIAK